MSNSAAKKARRRSNIFENDYEDLLYATDTPPVKIKNISTEKPKQQKNKKTNDSTATSQEIISSVPVTCTCNKCNSPVTGALIGILYSPISALNTPLVSYDCGQCKHHGRRSVMAKALPPDQFERLYF